MSDEWSDRLKSKELGNLDTLYVFLESLKQVSDIRMQSLNFDTSGGSSWTWPH